MIRKGLVAFTLAAAIVAPVHGQTAATPAQLPGKVAIAQKLGAQVPLDLIFHDEQGRVVRLGQYFGHGRPVLLNFVYFNCPMLCPVVLEGMASAMSELRYDIGKDFDVVTVSIDPRDKPRQAAEFRDRYVKRYGRLSAVNGWHFLTSNDDTIIHRLTDSVGFLYAYDGTNNQFAHGAALLVLTPDGRTSKYFYGFSYKARDLRLALTDASGSRIGGLTDQVLLLCYHYDPATGKYSANAMNAVRAGGIATILMLAAFIVVMVKREHYEPIDRDGAE